MASHALSRSLHSSRNHLIAYLPSLSAAATYFRAFCSDHDRSGRTINVEIMVESASDKNEGLPLTSWGPLGKGDARFPLPGQMGIGSLESENTEEQNEAPLLLGRPKRSDLLTTELPFDRHIDIYHQFKSQIPTLLKEKSKELRKEDLESLEKRLINGSGTIQDKDGGVPAPLGNDDYLLECSFFECPTLLKKDFNALFPGMDLTHADFTVITLCQKTVNDMTDYDPYSESEYFSDADYYSDLDSDLDSDAEYDLDSDAEYDLDSDAEYDLDSDAEFDAFSDAESDLDTSWSEEVDFEREELLHSFFDAAHSMTDTLKAAGFWADFIDPSSGKPFLSAHTNATFFETDERFRHLGFEIEDLGCCKVIRHHKWGTHAYVGCVFTTAPMNHKVIQELTAKL